MTKQFLSCAPLVHNIIKPQLQLSQVMLSELSLPIC